MAGCLTFKRGVKSVKNYRTKISIIAVVLSACVLCSVLSIVLSRSNVPTQRGISDTFCNVYSNVNRQLKINTGRFPIATETICLKSNVPVHISAVPFPITFILRNLGSSLRRKLRRRRLI